MDVLARAASGRAPAAVARTIDKSKRSRNRGCRRHAAHTKINRAPRARNRRRAARTKSAARRAHEIGGAADRVCFEGRKRERRTTRA
jgi:hypothetical protein